jgi:Bacteriocin-protection, YdeI or OmpD-Associated/Domain of unknown function (DUF1905)
LKWQDARHTVSMKFTTTIQGSGNKTGIEVPGEVVTALDAGKRPPVVVTINGKSYRSSIAVMGGQNLVSLSAANRKFTGVAAGDTVEVDLKLDTQPRIVEVPDDLAAAMAAEPAAQAFYATLSYSAQRRYVEPLEEAKTPDTRVRRITKAVADLKAGKK